MTSEEQHRMMLSAAFDQNDAVIRDFFETNKARLLQIHGDMKGFQNAYQQGRWREAAAVVRGMADEDLSVVMLLGMHQIATLSVRQEADDA